MKSFSRYTVTMPSKKNRNNILSKLNKQQKMDIKKKLMAISLKVDYYIYKNKQISATDATSYYHEVMSYQALCKHDERSLQVIEKLSRFMVAIIEEQTGQVTIGEPDILKAYTQDTDNDRVSPVYSMTEEDRHEFNLSCSQYNRQTTTFTESKDKTDLNEQNGSDNKNCADQSATAVTVEVNNSSADSHNNTNIEDSVEELVSFIDLTINESTDTSLGVREACSPSILNNTLRPETQSMQNMYADQCGQDIAEVDRVIHDLLKGDKSKSAQDDREKKINFKTIAGKHPNLHIATTLNVQNKLLDTRAKRQVNEQGKTTKPAKQRKIENTIEYVRKVKHDNHKTAPKNKNTTKNGSRSKVSPNNIPFYGNDLSWIENIKFVREVSTDEYEPTTLGEALWENCELPISWDNFV